MTLGVFLPDGVEDHAAPTAAGRSLGHRHRSTTTAAPTSCCASRCRRARPARRCWSTSSLPPRSRRVTATLTYRLDATPQGLVNPQGLSVKVRWPEGYDVTELPEGWARNGPGVASYAVPAWSRIRASASPARPPRRPAP